ncbi:hypothetical protein PHISCL_05733 [Aspergillus sclerotialis]|uniref:Uncharacterized protein n=1 Tax=Aspergillus sclerotialis TaxID=2070753 RepID=A0A3A2ZFG9_9EURO|nr:hypothetical protein PHISCL_05733 [Aspergillus sclerotialis]
MGITDVTNPLGPKRLASERGRDSPTSERKRQRREENSHGVSSYELSDSVQRRLPSRKTKAKSISYELLPDVSKESYSLSPPPDSSEDDYSNSGDDVNPFNERVAHTRGSGVVKFNDKIPPTNQRATSSSCLRDIQHDYNGDNDYIYSDASDDDNAPGGSPNGPTPQAENEHFRSSRLGQRRRTSRRVEPDNISHLGSTSNPRVTPTNTQSWRRQSTRSTGISYLRPLESDSRQAPTALHTPPQESQPENNRMTPASAPPHSTKKMQLQKLCEIAEDTRQFFGESDPLYQKVMDKVKEKQTEISKEFEVYLNRVRDTGDMELEAEIRNRGRQDGYSC